MPHVNRQKTSYRRIGFWTALLVVAGIFVIYGQGHEAKAGSKLEVGTSTLILSASDNLYFGNISSSSATTSYLLMLQNANVPKFSVDYYGNTYAAGTLTASSLSGAIVGTLSAANISSGNFGANTGGGNYSFPSNLGIGTTAPGGKLEVQVGAGAPAEAVRITGGANTLNDGPSLVFNGVSGSNPQGRVYTQLQFLNGAASRGKLVLGSYYSGYMDELTLWNGNVGIGTTSPQYKLDIYSADTGPFLRLRHVVSSGYAPASILLQEDQGNNRGQGIYGFNSLAATNWYSGVSYGSNNTSWTVSYKNGAVFDVSVADIGNALFTVKNSGNVGIGTTNPGAKLDVNGTIYASATGGFANSTYAVGARNPIWRFGNADGYGISYFQGTAGIGNLDTIGFHFGTATATSSLFQINQNGTITTNGKVGIGTTNPGYALDVNGAVRAERFRGINSLALATYATANPSSNVFLYSQPNDRDSWIYLDSADTGSNWGIYHRQIDSAVSGLPGNSIGFVGGGSSALQAYISLANGSAYFNGNVGIGTTTPTAKLEIIPTSGNYAILAGNYKIGNVATPAIGTDAVNKNYVDSALGNITSYWTLSGSNLYASSTAWNVGIGTAGPQSRLEVSVGAESAVPVAGSDSSYLMLTGSGLYGMMSGVLGSGKGYIQQQRFDGTATTYDLLLQPNGGNVGIGTTNPIAKLQIGSDWSAGGSGTIYLGSSGFALSNLLPKQIITTNSTDTIPGRNIGLALHNSTATAGAYAPLLVFSTMETGASTYNGAISAIGARTVTGSGAGGNYIDGEMMFYTAPTAGSGLLERMRITEGGNVGIGTTNPTSKLDVNGSAQINSTFRFTTSGTMDWGSGYNNGVLTWDTGYAAVLAKSGNILRLGANGNYSQMVINTSGNVGIGTTAPTARLEIIPTSGNYAILAGNYRIGNVATPIYGADAVNRDYLDSVIIPGPGTSTVGYWTANGTHIYNANSGNVGIGTTAPGASLHLDSANAVLSSSGQLFITSNDAFAVDKGGSISFGGRYNSAVATAGWAGIGGRKENTTDGDYAGYLQFSTRPNTSAFLERMRITSSGNVGIGTTAPNSKLDVFGSAVSSGNSDILTINTNSVSTGYYGSLVFRQSSSNIGSRITSGNAGSYKGFLAFETSRQTSAGLITSEAMRIDGAGNVGIGTTAPGAKFSIEKATAGSGTVTAADFQELYLNDDTEVAGEGPTLAFSSDYNSGASKTIRGAIRGGTEVVGANAAGFLAFYTNNPVPGNSAPERMRINSSGNIGIGTTNPGAKLHVFEATSLGGTLGNSKIISRMAGGTSNTFMHNEWLYRDANGADWMTARWHDGISVDSSFLTPGTDTRVWWERDPNNNIQSWGNAASTYLTINTGNVGIGTTTPTARLEIIPTSGNYAILAGNYRIGNVATPVAGTDAVNKDYVDSAFGGITFPPGAYYWNLNGSNLYASSTAWNVGIGTTAPANKLTIDTQETSSLTAVYITSYYDGAVPQGQILTRVARGTASSPSAIQAGDIMGGFGGRGYGTSGFSSGRVSVIGSAAQDFTDTAQGTYLKFSTTPLNSTTIAEVMRIDPTGNVGIGTTAPGSKLHIYQDAAAAKEMIEGYKADTGVLGSAANLLLKNYYDGNYGSFILRKNADNSSVFLLTTYRASDAYWGEIFSYNINNKLLMIGTGSTGSASIQPNGGNVGIGTTAPGAKLDVAGNARLERHIGINSLVLNTYATVNPASNVFMYSQANDRDSWLYLDSADTSSNWGIYHRQIDSSVSGLPANSIGFVGGGASALQAYISLANGAAFFNGNVGIGTTSPTAKLEIIPTSGNYAILAGNYKVGNVATPTAGTDAVNKDYVDSAIPSTRWLLNGSDLYASSTSWNVGIGTTTAASYKLNVAGNMNVTGTITANKMTVNTVDPLYRLGGVNYATFAASIAGGVKEEYLGRLKIAKFSGKAYEAVIDFDESEKGSDLWVWRQVVDFNKDNVEVFITPYGQFARTYYLIDGNRLVFRSDRPTEIVYRLVGKRFDWRAWPTKSQDQETPGLEVRSQAN